MVVNRLKNPYFSVLTRFFKLPSHLCPLPLAALDFLLHYRLLSLKKIVVFDCLNDSPSAFTLGKINV